MEVADRLKLIGQTLGAFLQIQNYLGNSIQQMSEHEEVFEKEDIELHVQSLEKLNKIIAEIYGKVNSLKGVKMDAVDNAESKRRLVFPIKDPETPEEQKKFERLARMKKLIDAGLYSH